MSEVFAVKIDATEFKKAELRLGAQREQAPVAISRALNRALSKVKTEAIRQVTKNYYIKRSLFQEKEIITMSKANKNKLGAAVYVRDGPLPLNYYAHNPTTPTPQNPKLLKVAVKKTGMKSLNHAFVASVNGNKIFERTGKFERKTSGQSLAIKGRYAGKKREMIDRKYGPAVAQIVKGEGMREQIEKEAAAMYKKRLDHEIKRLLEAKS